MQKPRSTSAILPVSAPGFSVALSRFGSDEGPHRCRSTGLPFAPVRLPTSTRVCGEVAQEPGTPSRVGRTGKLLEPWSAGDTTVSA